MVVKLKGYTMVDYDDGSVFLQPQRERAKLFRLLSHLEPCLY